MAGKKKLDQGPMLLPALDLDDIDDFLSPKPAGKRSPKESIREFKSAAIGGFKDRLNPKATLRTFMRHALPDGYSRLLGLYDEARHGVDTVVDGIEETQAASLEALAEKFQDNLPKLKGKVPDAVYERVKAKLEDKKEDYKLRRQIDQARNKKEDFDRESNLAVDNMFTELEEAQLDLAKANSDADHSKLEYEVKRDGIRAKLDKSRFDVLNRHLGMIADSTQRQSAFNDSVTYQFQRKSLELQMRNYLAMRSLLKVTHEGLQLHKDAYTALVKNTGMPEFLKATDAERIKFNVKQSMRDPFKNMVSKTASEFATNFLPSVFNNIGRKASGIVRGAADAGNNPLFALLRQMMADPAGGLGKVAGSELAGLFQSIVLPTVARKVRPGIQRASDRLTGGMDSRLAYGMDNLSAIAQQFATDSRKSTGAMGYLQDMVRMFAPQFKLNDLVKDHTYQTIDKGASFNQMTQRSIVEVIPGYLSRILHETRMIRTGDHSLGRESYDITRGQFVLDSKAKDNLSKRIIGMGARQSMNYSMQQAMGTFDEEGVLSAEAKHALEERLLRDAMMGKHFDPETYVRMEGYAPGTSADVLKELERFFKSRFKFDTQGKLAKDTSNYQRRQEYSVQFNTLRDSVKSPLAEIERILASGNHTVLRELGIIHTVEGEDRINYAQLREYYRDLGEGPEGDVPPSPTDPLMTRLRRDLKAQTEKARERLKRGRRGLRERAGNLREQVRAKGVDFTDRLQDGYQDVALNAAFAVHDGMEAGKAVFKSGVARAEMAEAELRKQVTDLMIVGRNAVVIKAEEIAGGELIDVNTNNVITQIKDITGEVIDRQGFTRITRAEAAMGLLTKDGVKLDILHGVPKVPPQIQAMLTQAQSRIGQELTKENGAFSRVKDLYLEGANDPVIKASALRAGEYVNVVTGDVLETIDDITDAVAHVSRPDEVIITAQEAATKLVDKTGRKFKSSKLLRGLTAMTRGSWSITKQLFKIGKATLKFTGMFLAKRLITLDAYLPGSGQPVLTSSKLKQGEYYDAKGNVLKSFDDLRDGVYGSDGNQLVSPEDVANLINRDGSKHTAAKKRSFIRRWGKKLIVGGAKAIGRTWWKGTKAYYKGMGNLLKRGLNKGEAKADAYEAQGITPTDGILASILSVLDRRLPKEEPKKGSTAWQLAQMENGKRPEVERKRGERDKETKGGLGLLAGLKNLFSRRKDEDSEESDGDTYINTGDFGGSDRDTDGKRKKTKPKGRMGRMMDRVKNSRMGKATGRFMGSRVGQGLATAGRGALTIGRGALMFGGGSLLGGAGTMLAGAGSMLAGAGGAILGVLASPIALGALAVGAVAVGGYFLWKRYKNTSGDIRSLRLMQYGISSTSDKLKVLKLEGLLEQSANKGPNPQLNVSAVNPKEIFDIVKIDPTDTPALHAFATWLETRFKPVFLTYLRAMHGLVPQGTLINELDEKLPDELKYELLEKTQTVEPQVYQALQDPFDPKDQLDVTPEDIAERQRDLLKKWKSKAREKPEEQAEGAEAGKEATTPATESAKPTEPQKKPSMLDKAKGLGMKALTFTPMGFVVSKLVDSVKDSFLGKMLGKAKGLALKASPAALGGLALVSAVSFLGSSKYNKLTTLQAVRVRAYGRHQLDQKTVQALFETEALLYKGVRFTSEGQANYEGNLDELIGESANYFGVDVTSTSKEAKAFTQWILERFSPTALAYFAAVKAKGPSLTPSRVESALSADDKLDVANAILTATYELKGERISIWKADPYFDNGGVTPDALKATAEVEVAKLKEEVEKAKLASPATSVKDQENQSKSMLSTTASKIFEGAKNIGKALKERMANVLEGAKERIGGAVDSIKGWLGLKDKPQQVGQSAYSSNYEPGGSMEQQGAVFTGFAKGNGGVWDTIPLPKKNKDRAAAMETLLAVQAMTGVDAELLATFCSIESSFDYLIKAPTSSATGWFQFINSTWDEQLRKHASKYGIPPDNRDRYLRKDPRINALMGAEFLKSNYLYLAERIGRAPTDTDLYCAHFMGAGGAVGFLKRDRNQIAASVYPKEAAANRSIYYKTTGQPRTIGEVYALMEAKVAKHRRNGAGTDVSKSPIGEPDQQAIADAQAQAVVKDTDFSDVTNIDATGEVNQGSNDPNAGSISMVADRAAAPMRMADPTASGGGNTAAVPSAQPTSVDSGQHDTARKQAIEENIARAEQADRAQAEQLRQRQEMTTTSITVMERQLETQIQMRDLLKIIADKVDLRKQTSTEPIRSQAGRDNDMDKSQSRVVERKPNNGPLPIAFNR